MDTARAGGGAHIHAKADIPPIAVCDGAVSELDLDDDIFAK